jgi:hypothetical protein
MPAGKQMPEKYNSHRVQSSTLNVEHLLQFQESMENLIFKMSILSNLREGKEIPVPAGLGRF